MGRDSASRGEVPTTLTTMPKADLPGVDGQVGLRVNHNLDVTASDVAIM